MTSESQQIYEYISSAQQWLQFGMYELALHWFEQAIALDSESTDAWSGKAEALRKLGRYEEAIRADETAIALQMNSASLGAEFWSEKGYNQFHSGDFEGAIASYDKALNIKPDDHQAWLNRGVALYEVGRYEEAISSYDYALEIEPHNINIYSCRGLALAELERHDEEIVNYKQALTISLQNPTILNSLGYVLFELRRFEEAIFYFDQAVDIAPSNDRFWSNRGAALLSLRRFDEGFKSLDQALELNPKNHNVWYDKGVTLSQLERHEEAIFSYEKALQIKPDDYGSWHNRGLSLANLGQYEAAIASYDKAINIKPDYHSAWFNRGVSLDDLGQYEAAIANYDQGLTYVLKEANPEGWGKLHRGKGDIYFYQAKCNQNIQAARIQYGQAITCYNTARQTLEAFAEPYLKLIQNLIKAHLGLGNSEAAQQWRITGLEVFRQLLNAQPTLLQKRNLETKFSGFSRVAVDSLVAQGETIVALETAERNKNRCLTWILDEWKETVISPSNTEIRQLLDPQTAIVYWHFSDDSLTTFILTPDSEDPILLNTLQYDRAQKLQSWIKTWNTQYNDYRTKKNNQSDHPWRKTLTTQLAKLKEILDIDAIESHLPNIQNLILIPHRDLHRFPIHALFSKTFVISYIPSAQVGITQKSKPIDRTPFLLSVKDPHRGKPGAHIGLDVKSSPIDRTSSLMNTEDPDHSNSMVFAQLEAIILNALFAPNAVTIESEDSDRATVETALNTHHGIFHFTGHGAYNDRHPEHSELALQGTDTLTAEEISHLDLNAYHLVSLSACETALTGSQSIETEYVGFISAFLQAGVSNVISTLWTVEETSNAYLMIRFYQNWLTGQSSKIALQSAQTWLRTATCADLCQWLKTLLPMASSDSGAQEYLQRYIRDVRGKIESTEPPYRDPYYWAAFTHTGL